MKLEGSLQHPATLSEYKRCKKQEFRFFQDSVNTKPEEGMG